MYCPAAVTIARTNGPDAAHTSPARLDAATKEIACFRCKGGDR